MGKGSPSSGSRRTPSTGRRRTPASRPSRVWFGIAAKDVGCAPPLLEAVVGANDEQPMRMLELAGRRVDRAGRRVAVLGLAFEPGTDDIRNSRAIPLVEALQNGGADIVGYDPVATENTEHARTVPGRHLYGFGCYRPRRCPRDTGRD